MSAAINYLDFEIKPASELKKVSNWIANAMDAYAADGTPNFFDKNNELVEGIYLGLPNDVYHALPALSSTGAKKFIESPALYYREYISDIERKRTTTQRNTFDTGTFGHELCLEPAGFNERYFRDIMPSDFPDALVTNDQIEAALIQAGLPAKEGKAEKISRLQRLVPTVDVTTLKTIADIDTELVKAGFAKAESKLDKAHRLVAVAPQSQVYDFLYEENRLKQGEPSQGAFNGEAVTLYGGKMPIDALVWDDAHRVRRTVMMHSQARQALMNGLPEVAIIARCPITNLMLKVKFDWLTFDDNAADVKTTASTKPEKFVRQIRDLHYNIQQSFYTYVASLVGISIRVFSFLAVEYVNADICQPYVLGKRSIATSNAQLMTALNEFVSCSKNQRWYGWSKEDCFMTVDV
jgi:hypothetical protein